MSTADPFDTVKDALHRFERGSGQNDCSEAFAALSQIEARLGELEQERDAFEVNVSACMKKHGSRLGELEELLTNTVYWRDSNEDKLRLSEARLAQAEKERDLAQAMAIRRLEGQEVYRCDGCGKTMLPAQTYAEYKAGRADEKRLAQAEAALRTVLVAHDHHADLPKTHDAALEVARAALEGTPNDE